jgi:hypothetical protein
MQSLVHSVRDQEDAESPLDHLRTAVYLSADLAARADEVTGYFVDAARTAGCSWAEIGSVLGVSKQAAQQRFVPVDLTGLGWNEKDRPMTDRLRRAIRRAHKDAKRLGVDYVDTEHLLLGLMQDRRALAARMIAESGADPDEMVTSVLEQFSPGGPTRPHEGTFTHASVKALDMSLRESRAFGHAHLGTEHVLLGLAAVTDGLAYKVLTQYGVNQDALRRVADQLLQSRS